MKSSGILAAALVLCLVSFAAAASPSQFTGLSITGIAIQDDEAHPWPAAGELVPLLGVKTGDRFSASAISDGISYLYLKGRFKDIRVDGFRDGEGVRLVYTLMPITVVDEIKVKGAHAISASKIREALPGVGGRELREDKFSDYRAAVVTAYENDGYYGTGVDLSLENLPERHHAALVIALREPEPTLIASISFTGNTIFSGRQLSRLMESTVGKPFKSNILLDKDTAAIVARYNEAGYPAAKTGPVAVSFRDHRAFVTIAVTEGPKVTAHFSGNHALSDRELRQQLLIWSEHDISDGIIDSSADKIKNLYRDDGFRNVKVDVKKAATASSLDLTFDVQEGVRTIVKEISVHGNRYFPEKQIRGEMALKESGWFTAVPYRDDLLDKDVEYLRDRYADAGFLSVQVKKKVDFSTDGRKALISIDIEEGAQTRTGAVTFEGNEAFSAAQLLDIVSLKPGAPYNERSVDDDRYRILSAYSNRGYLYARVEAEKTLSDDVANVKYKISEDRPVRIGRIILRGNERTKEEVIMRELLVKPGDAYDYGKILKSQQRIYRFGYFSQARFEPLRPGEKEYVKDMLLTVEERPAGSADFGVGYGDLDRARVFAEVSYRNLFGLGHYAGIRVGESDILKQAILNYQQPWLFGHDLQGKLILNWSSAKHINSDTREIYYETRQTSAAYGVEKTVETRKVSLTYAFENVENFNVEPGAILSPEDVGHVRVSSLTPALVWDLRDDIFNPRKGALYGITFKDALSALGSEADFTKLTVQGSWYVPVTTGIVTAFSTRLGLARPQRETIEVPIHERFYLGGSTTIRGFTQDSVGPSARNPDGTTTPTGGTRMVLFNLELRMVPAEGLGFVLFSDAGNVWVNQPIQLNDIRASYGTGIRYGTPIGPLRVDYGWKIHRRPGESAGELHFNIGHTF